VLTAADIGRFISDGYVAVRGAIPTDVISGCQDVLWMDLATRGVGRTDRSTWTRP